MRCYCNALASEVETNRAVYVEIPGKFLVVGRMSALVIPVLLAWTADG